MDCQLLSLVTVGCCPEIVMTFSHHQHLGQSQILVNLIPESSGTFSFTATANLLIPATPFPCVLRSISFAALDHLGERAFSLCRNLRQFPLPNFFCVTRLRQRRTWTACSIFEEAGQKIWEWMVVASLTRGQRKTPHTVSAW